MLDQTDMAILKLLQQNSRTQWREIGEQVHMTGQAVGNRIRKMEEVGIISGYTVNINHTKLGQSVQALVTVFMKSMNHSAFHSFIQNRQEICEAHRISGEGCYSLKVSVPSSDHLTNFLDDILEFGNYRVNISLNQIK